MTVGKVTPEVRRYIAEKAGEGLSLRRIALLVAQLYNVKLSHEAVRRALSGERCSDCGSPRLYRDPERGEVVCQRCGLVQYELPSYARDIGEEIESHTPRIPLDFQEKGSALSDRDLYLITGSPYIRQVKAMLTDPVLRKLKDCASNRLKDLGLSSDYVLGDAVGRMVKHFYACLRRSLNSNPYVVAGILSISLNYQLIVDNLLIMVLEAWKSHLNHSPQYLAAKLLKLKKRRSRAVQEILERHAVPQAFRQLLQTIPASNR